MVKIKEMIKVGGQFSGVGAFDQALKRLGIEYENIYQAEWDKYARQTYLHNYEEPVYYVKDVHDTPTEEITEKYGSLDIAMFSPPCQAFSLAGKRLGKEDQRGILFFNSHEFIKINKPRYFIFENVKGLISDDNGKTFQEWINLLGGKSVNGDSVLFPYPDSVPYHLYWKVLNAKDHGVPQNRERVFLIGIRDDKDNNFRWPVEERLVKRLKDLLEDQVDEKYFLSKKMIDYALNKNYSVAKINPEITATIGCKNNSGQLSADSGTTLITHDIIKIGNTHPSGNGMNGNVFDSNGISPTLSTNKGEGIKIKSETLKGYEVTNFQGNDISNTIRTGGKSSMSDKHNWDTIKIKYEHISDTACNQGVMVVKNGRSDDEKKRRKEHYKKTGKDSGSFKDKQLLLTKQDYSDTILANPNPVKEGLISESYKIRRLTPRECFRLMDFPDSFTWPVSDSQAYKQAGNSIVVNVLYKIIANFNL